MRVWFLTVPSGIQRSAAGRSRSEVRGTEISKYARESRTGGGVALVGDPSENMVPKSTDEAQEAAEEAKHKRQQQLQFRPAIDIRNVARW